MFSHFLRKLGLIRNAAVATQTVPVGGRAWHLAPRAMAILGPAGPDLDRWIASGRAKIVKSGTHRTVYRVALPAGAIYVKHCRINGFRAWARECLRPAKARLEFENLAALRERGLETVIPLGWGAAHSGRPGESFLITRAREGAKPFLEHVASPLTATSRFNLAVALGQFLARLHDAGIAHPDPHPGNLLVQQSADGASRFSLIDLHSVRFGRPLDWRASLENLVLFNRWFQLRASRADRLRFWHAYRRSRTKLPIPNAEQLAVEAREVERETAASNLRFWSGRQSRSLGTNRYFIKVKHPGFRGHAVADLPAAIVVLLANPDALFDLPGTRILKDSRTSKVAEVLLPFPDGPRALILKRVNVRHWSERLKNRVRPSAVLRSWANGHSLMDRLLPTPRPLAAFHRHVLGMPAQGYLLTEKVESPEELSQAGPLAIRSLARLLRAMHDRGVSHRDLKASNILLERGAAPTLIDLVGVRIGGPVSFVRRTRELARLNASFLASPDVSRALRCRFLRAYLGAGMRLPHDWKKWWKEISRATQAKVAKNRRSGRPLA